MNFCFDYRKRASLQHKLVSNDLSYEDDSGDYKQNFAPILFIIRRGSWSGAWRSTHQASSSAIMPIWRLSPLQ